MRGGIAAGVPSERAWSPSGCVGRRCRVRCRGRRADGQLPTFADLRRRRPATTPRRRRTTGRLPDDCARLLARQRPGRPARAAARLGRRADHDRRRRRRRSAAPSGWPAATRPSRRAGPGRPCSTLNAAAYTDAGRGRRAVAAQRRRRGRRAPRRCRSAAPAAVLVERRGEARAAGRPRPGDADLRPADQSAARRPSPRRDAGRPGPAGAARGRRAGTAARHAGRPAGAAAAPGDARAPPARAR